MNPIYEIWGQVSYAVPNRNHYLWHHRSEKLNIFQKRQNGLLPNRCIHVSNGPNKSSSKGGVDPTFGQLMAQQTKNVELIELVLKSLVVLDGRI